MASALVAPHVVRADVATRNATDFLPGTQAPGTIPGSCGITNTDTEYIAAVSHILYDSYPGYSSVNPNSNPLNYQGKSVTITATDRCEASAETDLDFSPAAFSQLADISVGRLDDLSWHWA
ncbi:hypothetical protein EDB87DRAFT_1680889 [Lactarius vividus]|nr:hypothetical protein EDB87DRAFT_1680889 [Lactarius vividus]